MKWLHGRFKNAYRGLAFCMKDRSVRFQFLLGLAAVLAGLLFELDAGQWLWMAAAIAAVIICEIFNSCIEQTVNYISTERHPLAGQIKDMAAAAVLCASLFALVVAAFLFLPKLAALFSGGQL